MIAFSIGPINIYRYGIMYALSIVIQLLRFHWIAHRKIIAQAFPQVQQIITTHLDTLLTIIVAGIIIGGRLGHVLIYERSYYSQHLLQIFNLQAGGMSFVGGFVGVMIGVIGFVGYHRLKFGDGLVIRDLICALFPFNIMLGRFANRLNQELYGRVVDLGSWSASQISQLQSLYFITSYPHIDQHLRWNTNLMEGLGEGLILGICTIATRYRSYRLRRQIQAGYVVGVFMVGYSIIRFVLEDFRDNPSTEFIGMRSKSQLWMILMGIIGIGLIFYIKCRSTGSEVSS